MLEYLVKTLREATGLPVRPFATHEIEPCLVYKYSTDSDNGSKRTDCLELRIIAFDMEQLLSIDKKVRKALLKKGDGTGRITHIGLNGGGVLEERNSQTIHKFDYYYITFRSEV